MKEYDYYYSDCMRNLEIYNDMCKKFGQFPTGQNKDPNLCCKITNISFIDEC